MNIALAFVLIASIAGIFAIIALYAFFHPENTNIPLPPPGTQSISIYDDITDELPHMQMGKAVIQVKKASDFPQLGIGAISTPAPPPPNCITRVDREGKIPSGNANSSTLYSILLQADKNARKEVKQRLSPDEFIPVAKQLCIYNTAYYASGENRAYDSDNWEGFTGDIATNDGSKYTYSLKVFWNLPGFNPFKDISANYHGLMPKHDRLEVYIFASNQTFFDQNHLLLDLQKVVNFKPVDEEPFAVSKQGIVIVNITKFYLILPNATEFYIDPDLKTPDGKSITVSNLYEGSWFSNFSEGIMSVQYDYEPFQFPAIWFVADAKKDVPAIDAHLAEFKETIQTDIAKCLEFKQMHPDKAQGPCP